MRLLHWGLLFILLLFGSVAGVGSAFPNFAVVGVFALLFVFSLVGLVFTGLVYLVRAFQFGRRGTYGRPAVTQRGEVVRSNSERVIADYFSRSGIRYVYEQPAMGRWGLRRISRPDFYLPDYRVYVEFWGLVSLPDNFAWVQHFVHHLAPSGIAGFVLANGSMSSNTSGEGEIRKNTIEADLVDCMVALPSQLFYNTMIPSCLWFVARDKKNNKFRDRRGQVCGESVIVLNFQLRLLSLGSFEKL